MAVLLCFLCALCHAWMSPQVCLLSLCALKAL
jgi:hypothetical protein